MRPELPWNVAGIPSEAREAARAAARREGLTLGEWLTRRILSRFAEDADGAPDEPVVESASEPESFPAQPPPHMAALTSEPAVSSAMQHVETELRSFARRMETSERAQAENVRAMSRTASEMNASVREHAQAFAQLGSTLGHLTQRLGHVERQAQGDAQRLERMERQTPSENLRDAIKVLHQGLQRLTDQMSDTSGRSATQISTITDNIETISGRLRQARSESETQLRALESRQTQLEERLRTTEKLVDQNARDAARAGATAAAIARLEEGLARLESRPLADPAVERRLNGAERKIAELAGRIEIQGRPEPAERIDRALDERRSAIVGRLDQQDKAQSALATELKAAIADMAQRQIAAPAPLVPPEQDAHSSPLDEVQPVNDPEPARVLSEPEISAPETNSFPDNVPRLADAPLPTLELNELAPPEKTGTEAKETSTVPQTMESFLAAARRSAQAAAAEAEADSLTRGMGGFGWGSQMRAEEEEPRRRLRLTVAAAAAIVVIALAVVLFGQRHLFIHAPTNFTRSPGPSHAVAKALSARLKAPKLTPLGNPKPTGDAGVAATRFAPPATPPARVERSAAAATSAGNKAAASQTTLPTAVKSFPPAPDRVAQLAAKGNAKAETILGLRYLDGDGVAIDDAQAAHWLERAADHGEAVAQYRLGTLYEHGKGVFTDAAKASHWYALAAAGGNRKAMHNLAVAYAQGSGVPQNPAEAARWFSKAAALGLADSEFNLAVLYERGLGVPQSLLDAYKWYAIAAAQGDAESKARLAAIAPQLSADDRAAAEHSAAQFRPNAPDVGANVAPVPGDLAG